MKDIVFLGVACVAAILVGLWLFFSGGEVTKTKTIGVPLAVLSEGQQSGDITERKNYRIRSADELDAILSLMYGSGAPSLPPVDFAKNEVLAVYDGTHTSGGFDVDVVSVVDDGVRRVTLRRTVPGDSCMTTSAITSPYTIVAIPRSDLPIVREEITEVKECR